MKHLQFIIIINKNRGGKNIKINDSELIIIWICTGNKESKENK